MTRRVACAFDTIHVRYHNDSSRRGHIFGNLMIIRGPKKLHLELHQRNPPSCLHILHLSLHTCFNKIKRHPIGITCRFSVPRRRFYNPNKRAD